MTDRDGTPTGSPTSVAEARARGARQYFTGHPCPQGHNGARYTRSQKCVACEREGWHRRKAGLPPLRPAPAVMPPNLAEFEERKPWLHIRGDWTPVVVLPEGRA